ncbi:hypothetical protein B0A50_08063 [Salinomyces thailandicus]|uniref:Uncharacterized protein n=1 Tax=Salinomyces thailandicus TaxID=706561 RepID=A0A4U0TKU2_9PEZI|nr:hypothetical protein B0A50_08063 [Salinomyces thailandica]
MVLGNPITIYHSCDPPGTKLLLHFKKDIYTPSDLESERDPPQCTSVPRPYGIDGAWRCAIHGCETCALTKDGETDLTLEVAKRHNIRGVIIRPSSRAITPADRVKDGEERGKWMYGHLRKAKVQAMRTVTFHPQARNFATVLRWLEDTSLGAELADSSPKENHFEAAIAVQRPCVGPGLPTNDELPFGADYANGWAPGPSTIQPKSVRTNAARARVFGTYAVAAAAAVATAMRIRRAVRNNVARFPDRPYADQKNQAFGSKDQRARKPAQQRTPCVRKSSRPQASGRTTDAFAYYVPTAALTNSPTLNHGIISALDFEPPFRFSTPASREISRHGLISALGLESPLEYTTPAARERPPNEAMLFGLEKRMLEEVGAVAQGRRKKFRR